MTVNAIDARREPMKAKADGPEITITIPSHLSMRGRVVDDVTGKPIERFVVHLSAEMRSE